jgi:predicted outer membrane protein
MHIAASMRTHLLCLMLLASCGSSNNDDEQNAIDEGDSRGNALAEQARADFSGISDPDAVANAAGIVSTINNGEIAQARLVLDTTTNSEVRDLASQILADHQANEAALQALMVDRDMAPEDNTVSSALKNEAMASLAQLQSDPNLDFDYVRMQVMMHQEAAVIVGAVRTYVDTDDAFREFLSNTRDTIEEHRQHAGDVLDDL